MKNLVNTAGSCACGLVDLCPRLHGFSPHNTVIQTSKLLAKSREPIVHAIRVSQCEGSKSACCCP